MSSQALRLRLVIRRHAVPEVKLVWPCITSEDLTVAKLLADVNEVVPLECGGWGLEDYVVELGDGKGTSFECLHFQQVGKIFKEDDQVVIRSLLTGDLRRRRLSGRHQISVDGRHLIDGLPFGRPWLRAPRDRPALELPPRKRARLTYDSESEDDRSLDDADEEYEPEQLLLEASPNKSNSIAVRARFDDVDLDADNEEEEEEEEDDDDEDDEEAEEEGDGEHRVNFHLDQIAEQAADSDSDSNESDVENSDEEDELGEELRLLLEDNALDKARDSSEKSDDDEEDDEEVGDRRQELEEELQLLRQDNAAERGGLLRELPDFRANDALNALLSTCNIDLSGLDQITALRSAFPLTSVSTIEAELVRGGMDLRKTYQALSKTNEPTLSFDEVMDHAFTGVPSPTKVTPGDLQDTTLNSFSSASASFPPSGRPQRPLIEEVESAETSAMPVDEGQEKGTPSTAPKANGILTEVESESEDASSSESSSSEESRSESDSDDESSSESDSDEESENESSVPPTNATSGYSFEHSADGGSSSEESDSDSSSSDDSSDEGGAVVNGVADASSDSDDSSDESSSSSSDDSDSASEPEEVSAKPSALAKAAGKPSTFESVKKVQPDVPPQQAQPAPVAPGCGLSRTQKRNARRREAKRLRQLAGEQSELPMGTEANAEDPEFLARKQALLSVVGEGAPDTIQERATRENETAQGNGNTEPQDPKEQQVNGDGNIQDAPHTELPQETSPAYAEPMQRRTKVDMGAGRRMLFSALGLKNPKSKADEDKLRKDLMKDVRPLKNPRTEARKTENTGRDGEEADGKPDAWRDKINYRAVECCHEGMVLSEPPFPFVQRWDPQQQYSSMRKRKRGSQNFYDDRYYDESYYDEDSQWYDNDAEWDEGPAPKKNKKKARKSKGDNANLKSREAPSTRDGGNGDDDIVLNYDDIPARGRPGSSQFTDLDDLPSLPSDVTTLRELQLTDVKPGMVMTWKQLFMSKATNWQPQLASVTGLVLSLTDDGTIHLMLAKRDREQNDKMYDEHTGQRIYEKFETPDWGDEAEDEDDGRREMTWSEMSEPRMVQTEPPPGGLISPAKRAPRSTAIEDKPAEEKKKEVRDKVQAELREKATGTTSSEHSMSIPSGQNFPRLDLPELDPPTATTIDSTKTLNMKIDSQDNQPISQDATAATATAAAQSHLLGSKESGAKGASGPNAMEEKQDTSPPEVLESDSMVLDGTLDDSGMDEIIPDSLPPLKVSVQYSEAQGSDAVASAIVEYPTLVVPSSIGSVHSGRQPPSNYELGGSQDHREDSVIPDTTSQAHKTEHRSPTPGLEKESFRSSSPFPTIEEIMLSASSRPTQSPVRSSRSTINKTTNRSQDRLKSEYEEVIRKLDDGDYESDGSQDRNKSIRRLFPNATQPDPSADLSTLPSPKPEKLKREQSRKTRRRSPFEIPEDSQIITLSSSPELPKEHYAEDDNDKTYEERGSSLPKGAGWVKKKENKRLPSSMPNKASELKARQRLSKKF